MKVHEVRQSTVNVMNVQEDRQSTVVEVHEDRQSTVIELHEDKKAL